MIRGFTWNWRSRCCTVKCKGNSRGRLPRSIGGRLSCSNEDTCESKRSEGLSLFGYSEQQQAEKR